MVPENIRFMKRMFGIEILLPLLNYDSRMFCNFPEDFHGNVLNKQRGKQKSSTQKEISKMNSSRRLGFLTFNQIFLLVFSCGF